MRSDEALSANIGICMVCSTDFQWDELKSTLWHPRLVTSASKRFPRESERVRWNNDQMVERSCVTRPATLRLEVNLMVVAE